MSQIIAGARPTRMELLLLKKRKAIAERGAELLREKLDALMIEFFQFIREISALRNRSQELLFQAYSLFSEAQVSLGFRKIEESSYGINDQFTIDTSSRNVIGVTVPQIQVRAEAWKDCPYSLTETTAKLDDAVVRMVEAVKTVSELSGAEVAVKKLAEAIATTRRRVNSLENTIIPRIVSTIRYIEMHLEEREREDFFRLKRIKKKLQEEA